MPRSVRMRASTGNAVIDIATPRKSASASGATGPLCGDVVARVEQQGQARAERERQHDRGGGDGARQLLPAADQQHVEFEPTMNMNSTRPSWARMFR